MNGPHLLAMRQANRNKPKMALRTGWAREPTTVVDAPLLAQSAIATACNPELLLNHGNPPEASGAHNPCLVHASLGVFLASNTPHHPVANPQPGSTNLPLGMKMPPSFLLCWWSTMLGLWDADLLYPFDPMRHGDGACIMHLMHTGLAGPHNIPWWGVTHPANTSEAFGPFFAKGMNTLVATRAHNDVP